MLYVSLVALGLAVVHANLLDDYGFAGVVGFKAEGMPLSCGGKYQPTQLVAFHHAVPCGSTVTIINPATGQSVAAQVAHQKVMYKEADSRIIDISPAVANAIGLNPTSLAAHKVVVRTTLSWAPVLPHRLKDFAFNTAQDLDGQELSILTNNLLGECGNCGTLGMVAVAQVTQNRVDAAYNGKTTIHGVVYDKSQFSWVKLNPTLRSAQPNKPKAEAVAALFMLGRLSGDALAVQYKVTAEATHYYAFRLINPPVWATNGKLAPVGISKKLESELHHRFYAQKPIVLASR